ncbi:DUF3953 domain-containing protein [Gracilibacillus ureilyticus]|uniref:DUF3953 domain-containing protein n=1 Tax=Gracilibacillus ureilyticus TaxID=531814 RepID=UPI000B7F3BD1|nr:DUF3953 domain-containing protein [Gracilibacillus ureilyticus]
MFISKIVLSGAALLLIIYCLVTGNYDIMPFANMLLGFLYLFMGIDELQQKRKAMAILLFLTSVFIWTAAIYSLL